VIDELFAQMEWADAILWRAVLATPAAQDDPAIREKLLHAHMVQHAYLMLWRGAVPNVPGASHFPNLQSVLDWAREFYRLIGACLEDLKAKNLDAPFNIPWADRIAERFGEGAASPTLRETLIQIPMHTAYHRGQVNTRLRELGGTPPLTDFIAWVWFGKPAAEWP
jgi:uncharacterized damage-inducible protein DinB